MNRKTKTFAPRNIRYEEQTNSKEEDNKYQEISNQDAKISLAKTEVTKITYQPFRNKAFNKVERGLSIIKFSNKGLHVLALNKALNELGYKVPEKETLFFDETKIALMRFQRDHGIKVSGMFDNITLLKMDEALEALNVEEEGVLSIPERAKLLYEAFEYKVFIFPATNEDKIFMALEKLSEENRKELIKYYNENYKPKRKRGLVEDLYEELDNDDLYKAIQLLHENYYEESQQEPQQEPEQKPEKEVEKEVEKDHLLREVIVTSHPWIKSKTTYTIQGEQIDYECFYKYKTPVLSAKGSSPEVPQVVRKVLIQKDDKIYHLMQYPYSKDIKKHNQNGEVIREFSINAKDTGIYTFVFIIEDITKNEFNAYTTTHQVMTLEEAASDELLTNNPQTYSNFRQQVAYIDLNLSKGVVEEQKSSPDFYIESESFQENPAKIETPSASYIPKSYYSIKGKAIPKDHSYFWFAEINTPKEMSSGASALLGAEYAKNANVHGYKRGEYFGRDGWNMNSTQKKAAFLGSLTGVFTIHCLVLNNEGKVTKQQASYKQVVLPKDDYQSLQNFRKYKKDIDKSFNTMLPQTALALNAVVINEETTKTISLNLFLGKSKTNPKNYVLTDLTPGLQNQRTFEGDNIKDLFDDFDSKNTYPDGILGYEIPANSLGYPTLKGNFTTDGTSFYESLSSKAGWASLGLSVAGLVASFTPAAPIAPYLFVAAATTGVAAGTGSIIDKVQKGTLTNETLALDTITIASSFLGMGGAMSRILYKGLPIIKISETGLRYIILTDFALDGAAGLMITVDGLESILAVNSNKNLTTAEKIDATVKILAQLTLTVGLLVLSRNEIKPNTLNPTTKGFNKFPNIKSIFSEIQVILKSKGINRYLFENILRKSNNLDFLNNNPSLIKEIAQEISKGNFSEADLLKMFNNAVNTTQVKEKLPTNFIKSLIKFGKKEDEIITYFRKYHNIHTKGEFFNQIENLLIKNKHGLTASEAYIVWGYTTNLFYWDLNHWLRTGIMVGKTRKISNLLSATINKLPKYDGIAYRAIQLEGDALKDFLKQHSKVGSKVTYNDFLSAGSNKKAAFFDRSKKNVKLLIEVKSAPIISNFSDGIKFRGYQPDELLIDRGKTFKVKNYIFKDGIHYINLVQL
jgi:hypothetical protein